MRLLCSVLLGICLATAAYAETQHDTFLYMVEKAGHENSFLIGTIHMGQLDSDLPMGIKAILSSSSRLIVETNTDEISAEDMANLNLSMLDLKNPLSDKIGNRYVAQLAMQLQKDESFVDTLKPWAALMSMAQILPEGYYKDYGMDALLIRTAKVLDKKIVNLEDVESVLLYTNLPEDKVILAIKYLSDNFEQDLEMAKNVAKQYYANDANGLLELIKIKNEKFPDYQFWDKWDSEVLLKKRNLEWIPKIESQLLEGSAVIAVGAAHLYGEHGLVVLLRQNGFNVTPMVDKNSSEHFP